MGLEQPLSPVLPQENGRRQKQHLGLRFDALYSILEERKKELLQSIAREQEAKVQRVRGLIRQYGDHLEASSKLVESAIQAMEEPQMALYLQVCADGGVQGGQDSPWGGAGAAPLGWRGGGSCVCSKGSGAALGVCWAGLVAGVTSVSRGPIAPGRH